MFGGDGMRSCLLDPPVAFGGNVELGKVAELLS